MKILSTAVALSAIGASATSQKNSDTEILARVKNGVCPDQAIFAKVNNDVCSLFDTSSAISLSEDVTIGSGNIDRQ